MKIQTERIRAYGKLTITRAELLKLGFDTDDAFEVHLDSRFDGHGITFTLHEGKSEKYMPKPPVPEVAPKPKKKFWLWGK